MKKYWTTKFFFIKILKIYFLESKLDCFGVAFSVVAGCQVLGFNDVHLGKLVIFANQIHFARGPVFRILDPNPYPA